MLVTFPAGSLMTYIVLDIRQDALFEGPEQFYGRLRSTNTIANLDIAVDTVTVNIVDDDGMQDWVLCI